MPSAHLFLAASLLTCLAACAPDVPGACASYVDALNTCTATANGVTDGSTDADPTIACAAWDKVSGSAVKPSVDYLDCLQQAYAEAQAAGTCSTTEAEAAIDLSGCVPPT